MKRYINFLGILLFALTIVNCSFAQEVTTTVADGTTTNMRIPVFGSGAGIGVSDCVRSASGCSYELSYNFILYNSGISGFIIYFAALSQIVWGLLTQKTQLGNSLALAFICGLIANATNPYFSSSFDFLWWAFIPLFYLKACENEKSFFSVKK